MNDSNPLPDFFQLRQRFPSHKIDDVAARVGETLREVALGDRVQAGQRVAIAVGSRGISNLARIVGEVVHHVRRCDGEPVIVPAMGSHGGATPDGQAGVLAKYGITPQSMGCPIDASMDTIEVGMTDDGVRVHFAKSASEADHVIVVNRIKPHTRLTGQLESGLIKMLMIGLGKHRGASLYHQVFPHYHYRLDELAGPIVQMLLEKMPITLGLAIVEDAFEQTSHLEAIPAANLLQREPQLLELARQRLPLLPFDHADLLIVDSIGKEISGTGMDTNVIGRKTSDKFSAGSEGPQIRQIYVRSLTEQTAGNASGIGIAEYCHRRVVQAMDAEVTRINCVTSAHVTAGAIPLTFNSDHDVLQAVVAQAAANRVADLKWMWIVDTLHLDRLACSRAYYDEANERGDLQVLTQPEPLRFDSSGNLLDLPDPS